MVRGETGQVLVSTADRADDTLVIGVGRGRRLLPSVARYCLRHATCPVLAVPRPALQRELESYHRRTVWHLRTEPVPHG